MSADLATLAARFVAALHDAGIPGGPDRAARFARAVAATGPGTLRALRAVATATLLTDPAQFGTFDAVFDAVFGGVWDPVEQRGDPAAPRLDGDPHPAAGPRPAVGEGDTPRAAGGTAPGVGEASSAGAERETALAALASGTEHLATRDFATLSAAELLALTEAMRRFRLATSTRRSRRTRPAARGDRIDLRATLRAARRTGGHPVQLARRRRRVRPRRLVVLCDISGSMEPYARALLQLLWCAADGARAEVFTFATRLTRLTPALRRHRPQAALERAARTAPDWSGGSRIGDAIAEFTDGHGRRGTARGAVVLVLSDGWDTGDPARLAAAMARLSRVAHRIVWANPRTASPRYRPRVGGMAAAWPYCDAVVSAHGLDALGPLLEALQAP